MYFSALRTTLCRLPAASNAMRRQSLAASCVSCQAPQRAFLSSSSSFPEHSVMILPALSPTMEQGTLVRWALNEGDEIGAGTVLCEIETDKATVDYEAQDEGFLAKKLVAEGTADLPVGTPIGVIVEDKDDIAAFANFTAADATDEDERPTPPAPEPTPEPAPVQAQASPPPPPPAPEQPKPVAAAAPAAPAPTPPAPVARKPAAPASRESPLTKMLEAQRASYEAKYGSTLTVAQKATDEV
jgi:pyruvate dehydrogenase E2 component (dihydrolipoamide acetyltransferase)